MENPSGPGPNSNESGTPYGDNGHEAGLSVHQLLEYLSRAPISNDGWQDDDAEALSSLVEFEWFVPHIRATSAVSAEEMHEFDTKLNVWHDALPFTEAGRHWLVTVTDGALEPYYEAVNAQIGHREEHIISAGLQQIIKGRDLMRHWLAWRRESDEYAGQGTLDLAREALRGIYELLIPGQQLPVSYILLKTIDPN